MRLSYATVAILQAVTAGSRYGFDVMAATGLPSGTVYPALRRLEKHGLVRAHWENQETARAAKRPRRRYYETTPNGASVLTEALERYHSLRNLRANLAER